MTKSTIVSGEGLNIFMILHILNKMYKHVCTKMVHSVNISVTIHSIVCIWSANI